MSGDGEDAVAEILRQMRMGRAAPSEDGLPPQEPPAAALSGQAEPGSPDPWGGLGHGVGMLSSRVNELERAVGKLEEWHQSMSVSRAPAMPAPGKVQATMPSGNALPDFTHAECGPCGLRLSALETDHRPGGPCPRCGQPLRKHDAYTDGRDTASVAARVRNLVSLGSTLKTDEGSHMLALVNYAAHTAVALYGALDRCGSLSPVDRELVAREVKAQVEGLPARFAAGIGKGRKG